MTTHIAPVQPADIPELTQLINSAYRGEPSRQGWTTEADLIQGDRRTDEANLRAELAKPGATMLKCADESGRIRGCVYLQQRDGNRLYLGMLTVSPEEQGGGIGKQLLRAAEDHARAVGCRSIYMGVISERVELIAWYRRHGYQPNGETKPFPPDNEFGTPVRALAFLMLEKVV